MKSISTKLRVFTKKEPIGTFVLLIIIVISVIVFLFPVIFSFDPYTNHLDKSFAPASTEHLLGTDQLGRDVLARIIYGGRMSLLIGISTTILAFSIGVTLGLISGVRGGALDVAVVQLSDISFAIPSLLLAIAAAAVLPSGWVTVVIALTLSGWGSFARISRAAAKQLVTNDYVLAGRMLGGKGWQILIRHILPNAMSILIVTATLKMGSFILGEAALSFLGLGVKPPVPSWGGMVNDSYRFLQMHPMLSFVPGVMIALLVTSFNLLGDSLRDFYDIKKDS